MGCGQANLAEFKADNLTDGAAALTYYAMLSLFPALLALLSVLGLLGRSAMQTLTANLTDLAPEPARQILTAALENLRAPGVAGLAAIGGTALAVWPALSPSSSPERLPPVPLA